MSTNTMRIFNRLTSRLDQLFDTFLTDILWPVMAVLALIIYIQGVTA